jgi:U6 snRNA phosphodiesterase
MVLVDYPDSDEDEEENIKTRSLAGSKRKADQLEAADTSAPKSKLPALPASFRSLYATNARGATTDDPALHAGRTRQIPHVVGNWPTHVYLEWYPSHDELLLLEDATGNIRSTLNEADRSQIHTFLRSDLGAQLPLHISLSAPLVLKTEDKKSFQEKLQASLSRAGIKAFNARAFDVDWVSNYDKSRFFLVLKLSKPPEDELNRLLRVCNNVARLFDLPPLYDHSSEVKHGSRPETPVEVLDRSDAFHSSIAWSLQKPGDSWRPMLKASARDGLCGLKIPFSVLKLKMGNVVVDLPLDGPKALG